MTYLYIFSDTGHDIAQTIQAQIKETLGVEIALESLEAKVFFDMQFEEGNNHFSFGGWTADYNDPMDFF
ncbi:hypothetical protein J6TS1_35990 [Siminovitchia terrae]|uniref:Uncharacterized protein n=1 Tax=Siminovitchia terrae TaxID=1914933 RepID=A0ABQ4L0J3_SIMTE|nr:hypothetical protein [Siminovitchia terrae]GIN90943.1 hypothetical protein J22TS1_19940 [Siminovitchia terrae]GIN97729.1 hypothetical protein J6TS1_35990 [Siminovitchia terrae]